MKIEKFRLKEKEINEFYDSLSRINLMNNRMMKHILNFKELTKKDDFPASLLASTKKIIDFVSKIKKDIANHHVCEYEFHKIYELFYLTLYHIVKYEERIRNDFFLFAEISILPILKKLKFDLDCHRFMYMSDLTEERAHIQSMKDEKRHILLLCFLKKFLFDQNHFESINQCNENYIIDDLLPLCFNVFTSIYLHNQSRRVEFYEIFRSKKYCISSLFTAYLFSIGRLSRFSVDIRIELRNYYNRNNLDYENRFLQEKIISPSFDVMYKYISNLNLSCIIDIAEN